jgi:PBP1b-binding outer membrane lipoprotein LpoB
MKTKILLGILGLALITVGCVNTVSGRKTAAMPFVKDRVQGYYERPVDQVYEAAKNVVMFNGTMQNESILHDTTNAVRTVEGRVNLRKVWIRVEGVDAKTTAVVVQTRTSGGATDIDLAHELEKQIALKLVR